MAYREVSTRWLWGTVCLKKAQINETYKLATEGTFENTNHQAVLLEAEVANL